MRKFNQFSLVDFLTNLLPTDLKPQKDHVDPKIVQALYNVWKDPKNKIGNRVYKAPKTVSRNEVESLISQGLVQKIGDSLKITSRGSNILKIMILGDDKSSFENKIQDIDYITASKNIRRIKKSKQQKIADLWWKDFNV